MLCGPLINNVTLQYEEYYMSRKTLRNKVLFVIDNYVEKFAMIIVKKQDIA